MGEILVAPIADDERAQWDRFVEDHPGAAFGHLSGWRDVIAGAYGKRCDYLAARRDGAWLGVAPFALFTGPPTGRALISLPYLDQGGILAAGEAAAAALWTAALELAARRGAASVELRGGAALSGAEPSATRRFRLTLELPGAEEELWRGLGPKVRNQIRKSERSGLETRAAGAEELPRFYEVFARNMRDLGSPVHSRDFFARILAVFPGRARLYLTARGERPVAGALLLTFRDLGIVPWASALRAERPSCPNHSLYWRILRDLVGQGLARFDFGRSTAGTGTYHFKKQWGATPHPLVWRRFDPSGAALPERHLDPRRNRRLAAVWRRLPLALANSLGPRLRHRLPN